MKANRLCSLLAVGLCTHLPMLPAQAAPTVDSILAKYVTASGGKDSLEKISSRVIKGIMEAPAMNSTNRFQATAKVPDKQLTDIDLGQNGSVQEGFDGTTAWSRNPFEGLRIKSGDELSKTRRDAVFQRALKMKTVYPDLAFKGTQKIEGEDAEILESKPTPATLERFFFSAKTGRLLRQESQFNTPAGEMKTAINSSDYRPVDKIQYPHLLKLHITTPAQEFAFTLRVSEITHNVAIPDSKFAKPAE